MILEQEMHQEEEKRKNLEEKKRIREQEFESSEPLGCFGWVVALTFCFLFALLLMYFDI